MVARAHDPLVCLVRPRAGEAFRFSAQSLSLPLGLAYIAGALEAAGRRVAVVDAVSEAPRRHTQYFKGYLVGLGDEEVVARIPGDTGLIGITATFTHEWPALVSLIEAIRRRFPSVPVVLGGEHVTAMPDFCLASSRADGVVMGEGEQTVVELVDALAAGRAPAGLPGLAWRDADSGEVLVGPRRDRHPDPDALAPPAWHHFAVETYHRHRFTGGVWARRVTIPVLATRGCPYRCTYCTNPGMWTTRWIPRDPVRVVDEIQTWVEHYGARNFPFQDLTAILRKDWIVTFCTELIARDLDVRWQFPTGTRCEVIDDEVAGLMKRSGMIGMAFAPESGSERTRELIRKQMGTEPLLAAVSAAARAELNVAHFIVVGFPHDTPESLAESLRFMDRLVDAGADEVSLGYYMTLPGTELFEQQYARGEVRLDARYFGHILQNTELWPSVSFCPGVGRLALTLWSLRIYARFFRRRWLRPRRRARRDDAGRWDDGRRGKLPDALRFAARSLLASLAVRLAPRWMPRRDEKGLLAGWDELYRGLRRARDQTTDGVSRPPDARPPSFWSE